MGLQKDKGREQKEKELGKKVLFLLIAVFLGSFLFKEIQDKYTKSKILSLNLGKSEIQDFLIVGKGKNRFIVRGLKLLDEGKDMYIDKFLLSYIKKQDVMNIKSKKAIFSKEENSLFLKGNVGFFSKNLSIETPFVKIDLQKKIAENDNDVKIQIKNLTTYGRKLFIDLENETLKLKNLKSIIRGS